MRLDEVDGRIADKVRNKQVVRTVVDGERRVILLEHTVVDQADGGGERHGFHLIVRDVYECASRFHVQTLQLISHFQTKLCVQIRQRFVHKQHTGFGRERSCDCHTLLLTA